MRVAPRSVFYLLPLALVANCGGGDSNAPQDPFPDAAGVYEISGGFDGISSSDGSFTGTLTLTQASRGSGTLGGSAAIVAEIGGNVINFADDVGSASVSPSGVIAFTLADAGGTWTFSGTLSGNTISQGRHTISAGGDSFSGNWQGTRATATRIAAKLFARSSSLAEMVRGLLR